ncbi:peptide-methionine (R)-S-oxide reductase [Sphingomonas gilva]|uniref:peptide-methionine (R)-S-oxide reductase n=1 Tax=Sphingomonas gilva TaxID=2305907 RepID=A0A396S6H3_9SPHN|nr:peptide-methionine (R)-S-oxide reductase MsrB [Sphingomonas gilva]RHW19015.1 peptide-methionine (R)-S-oxide reductase [Sphingomonas gilva]
MENRTTFDRRQMLFGAAALTALAACGRAEAKYPVTMTDAEWKKKLGAEAYAVLRKAATERPWSSPLNKEKRAGTFVCKGCGQALYSSKTKFESGTGWPSFWAPIDGKAVGTKTDFKIGFPRTEVHCSRCGGHLGHIFDDGPEPTGKRHCINGLSLVFRPGRA